MIDRAAKDERIVGIGLCTREGALDRRTEAYPAALPCDRARTVADSAPPMLAIGGKCCVNLVLAGASTKGHAVEALVACTGAAGVLFMGDDVTDESVYRMSRPSWLTIHVGRTEHVTGASFYVDTQRDVAGVLRRLVDLTHTLSR
jgi:trehalose-6-phosphatase